MDEIDRLLVEKAKIHMIRFELGSFKRDFPSLYHTIRAMFYETLNK